MRTFIIGVILGVALSTSAVLAVNNDWFDQQQRQNQLRELQDQQRWNEMLRQQDEQRKLYQRPC